MRPSANKAKLHTETYMDTYTDIESKYYSVCQDLGKAYKSKLHKHTHTHTHTDKGRGLCRQTHTHTHASRLPTTRHYIKGPSELL